MEQTRLTGVTLEILNSKPKPECRHIIRNLVNIIDGLILTAHDAGTNSTQYDLDTAYAIPTMGERDSTLYVYSELVETYRMKGFKPTLTMYPTKTTFALTWQTVLTDDERKRREKIINNVRVPMRNVRN